MNDPTPPGGEAPPGQSEAVPAHDPGAEGPAGFPWPPAEYGSIAEAAVETWRRSVFRPASFFRRMPLDLPLGSALLYLLLIGILGAGIQLFWDMVWLAIGVEPTVEPSAAWLLTSAESAADALIGFLLTPLFLVVLLYVGSAITHVILLIFGGAPRGFGATLRVNAFAHGPQLFAIVPVVGMFIAVFWSIAVIIVGLREAHGVPGWKPAVAVLAPFGCLILLLILAALLIAMGTLLMPAMGV